MAKRKKYQITKEQIDRLQAGKVRQDQKEDGMFDGRYRTRTVPDKKKRADKRSCRGNSKKWLP
jgi:hypothetical protein